MKHMNPAECVIKAFGGVGAAARALGLTRPAVSRWRERKCVPSKSLRLVAERAKELGVDLTSDDLIRGRAAQEVG